MILLQCRSHLVAPKTEQAKCGNPVSHQRLQKTRENANKEKVGQPAKKTLELKPLSWGKRCPPCNQERDKSRSEYHSLANKKYKIIRIPFKIYEQYIKTKRQNKNSDIAYIMFLLKNKKGGLTTQYFLKKKLQLYFLKSSITSTNSAKSPKTTTVRNHLKLPTVRNHLKLQTV